MSRLNDPNDPLYEDFVTALRRLGLLTMATATAEECGTTLERVFLADKAGRMVTRARWRIYAMLRHAGLSMPDIGRLVGRDPTTVRHALSRLESGHQPYPVQAGDASYDAMLAAALPGEAERRELRAMAKRVVLRAEELEQLSAKLLAEATAFLRKLEAAEQASRQAS